MAGERRHRRVRFGQTVYGEDGDELGRVQRFEDGGFRATTAEGVSTLAQVESEASEKTLLWRCAESALSFQSTRSESTDRQNPACRPSLIWTLL